MYACYVCKDTFRTVLLFKKHIRTKHFDIFKRGQFTCGQTGCGRKYSLLNSLGKHLLSAHTTTSPINTEELFLIRNTQSPSEGECSNRMVSEVSSEVESSSGVLVTAINLGSTVEKSLINLTASLYANPHISRNAVQTVMEGIGSFSRTYNENVISLIRDGSYDRSVLIEILKASQGYISKLDSDHKRLKIFEEKGTYIPAKEILLGTMCEYDRKNGFHSVPYSMQIIQMTLVLQNVFAKYDLAKDTLEHVRRLQSFDEPITNIMQGKVWKDKLRTLDSSDHLIHLPIVLFYDDFEISNPLGSHAGIHKIGGVYISLPFLPKKLFSLLENIYILALFHTSDRNKFGNKMVFNKVIDELNALSERGIPLSSSAFTGIIKFHVVAIAGDNLGLNGMLGFVESFIATKYCRICTASKDEVQSMFQEDTSKLRTLTSYYEDLALKDPRNTGIKTECVWFKLRGFDLFDNVSVDFVHDYLEGICRYAMNFLLIYLVHESKLISFQALESRIVQFSYGPDSGTKPSNALVKEGSKCRFKTSASEMCTLVRYFGLIVGSEVPSDDNVWTLFMSLRQILDELLTDRVHASKTAFLTHLIEDFLGTFCKVTKSGIKPKFHFLVHYPQMFLKFGPLTQVWTMRFEAKHQFSKIAARATKSRINITKTLAARNQLSLNYRFLAQNPTVFFTTGKRKPVLQSSNMWRELSQKKNIPFSDFHLFSTVPRFDFEGITLKVSDIVTTDLCIEAGKPLFARILSILVDNRDEIYLHCQSFTTHYFDSHYHAYLVTTDDTSCIVIKTTELYSIVPNTLTTLLGHTFVTLRSSID
uniref:C2H2-type domain-containing protein n=2 Tax=Cacopsylla melanoneura TaxID=428564 RepID=A0A8D8ZTC5_9HEMI